MSNQGVSEAGSAGEGERSGPGAQANKSVELFVGLGFVIAELVGKPFFFDFLVVSEFFAVDGMVVINFI